MASINTKIKTFTIENFPLISAYSKRNNRVESALIDLNQAVFANLIYNSVFQDIKSNFGHTVNDTWHNYILIPYFFGGKYKELPDDVNKVIDASVPYSLHDIFALKKRIDKCSSTHPAAQAIRQFVSEFFPIAEAMNNLKSHIIKGRQPNPNPKPENPNKIVKTCPCCFRRIAIDPIGLMVHHGYQRPGDGYQTASCPGIRFKPLEFSPEGLDWLIAEEKKELANLQKNLKNKDNWTTLLYRESYKTTITITPDHPKWEYQKKNMLANLESDIRFLSRTVKDHVKIRVNWVQKK